jgi:hypothetical protein
VKLTQTRQTALMLVGVLVMLALWFWFVVK